MQHEGLKHQLTMTGLLVHKAAQATDGILQKLIDPINKVNFKNRAHQEQLKVQFTFMVFEAIEV